MTYVALRGPGVIKWERHAVDLTDTETYVSSGAPAAENRRLETAARETRPHNCVPEGGQFSLFF